MPMKPAACNLLYGSGAPCPDEKTRIHFRRSQGGYSPMQLLRLVVVILSLSLSVFASDSPFSGTWKLNLAKSKFTPPVPQSDIAVINADDNSIKFSEDVMDDKGQSTKMSTDAKFDGNDYPWTGDPDADSISYKRVNDHTLIAT